MTYTYNGDLATDLDVERFHLGDTVEDSGVLPSGLNFTDDELGGLQTLTGTVNKTVSAAMAAVAAQWSSYANLTVGPRKEEYAAIADAWDKRRAAWNKEYNIHQTALSSIGFVTRVDGFSDDLAADDV